MWQVTYSGLQRDKNTGSLVLLGTLHCIFLSMANCCWKYLIPTYGSVRVSVKVKFAKSLKFVLTPGKANAEACW